MFSGYCTLKVHFFYCKIKKKEIKMIFLKDVFQTTDEIKQNEEKFKSAVEASFHQLDTLVRPYLSEAQNETLSEILERLVASVAEHSFQIGYSRATVSRHDTPQLRFCHGGRCRTACRSQYDTCLRG